MYVTLTIDYDSAGYSVTIEAGETEGSRSVSITMDSISGEGDETFTNRIESVSTPGVTVGERESIVTIRDTTSKYNIHYIVVCGCMTGCTPSNQVHCLIKK